MIKSFFNKFSERIERLQQLKSIGFEEEAFTLCLVYIDRLASGHFGGAAGRNAENFCRALSQLSGNPLFGMIHPRQLREQVEKHFQTATGIIDLVTHQKPAALLQEKEVADEVRKSSLPPEQKEELVKNLWRASMAKIAYDYLRVPEIHGPGSGGLSFAETIYNGQTGIRLDFDKLHDALKEIFRRVFDDSMRINEWFGNPDYLKKLE